MTYKGYTGALEIDEDSGELFGTVLGTRDIITFVGKTVEEARKSLQESVNFYLERCAATGKEPDRPFSGQVQRADLLGGPSRTRGARPRPEGEPERRRRRGAGPIPRRESAAEVEASEPVEAVEAAKASRKAARKAAG